MKLLTIFQGETRRNLAPGVAFNTHLVATFKKLFHVDRVKTLGWFLDKVGGNVAQVEIIAIALAQRIYLVYIADTLGSDQRINRACSDWNNAALGIVLVWLKKRITDHIDLGLTVNFQFFGNLAPVLTPVTMANLGRVPAAVQPANKPAPKAPLAPPPEIAK